MKKLIEILPNIYGVKVPMDATDFGFGLSKNVHLTFMLDYRESIDLDAIDDFKILGTITATEISFDASEVVESTEIDVEQYDGILMAIPRFWDYELESFSCSSSDESFRSALPKEIYFENPFGKEPDHLKYKHLNEWNEYVFTPRNLERYSEDYDEWQTAQQNITQKLLILQKL